MDMPSDAKPHQTYIFFIIVKHKSIKKHNLYQYNGALFWLYPILQSEGASESIDPSRSSAREDQKGAHLPGMTKHTKKVLKSKQFDAMLVTYPRNLPRLLSVAAISQFSVLYIKLEYDPHHAV